MKKFGDEQSNLLDQFERLTFEVQLNQAILGRSLSEPSTMGGSKMPLPSSMAQPPTAAPPPLVSQVRQGRRGWGFHKVLKKFLKPIFRRKGGSSGKKKMPADPKDQRYLKAFSRSMRVWILKNQYFCIYSIYIYIYIRLFNFSLIFVVCLEQKKYYNLLHLLRISKWFYPPCSKYVLALRDFYLKSILRHICLFANPTRQRQELDW